MTESTAPIRLRRLRQNPSLRNLLNENSLNINDFVLPLFIKAGAGLKQPITSMPSHFQWSVDRLHEEIDELKRLDIKAVILFGIPEYKDAMGLSALDENGVIPKAIQEIKKLAPNLLVIADLCLCEYTDHGHCGVIEKNIFGIDDVHNDKTLELLAKQAIVLAKAGADMIAPSGMMDHMVQAIRLGLDGAGFDMIPILSYAVKYASAFYGPFREAAEGAPKFGNRDTYQMNPSNVREALREAALDIKEGADLVMVKPAQLYLDVIYRVKQQFPEIPLCAYQVSGEFAMIKAAALRGWLDETKAMIESLLAIKRAGADLIITYFAKDVAKTLR